MRKEGDVAMRTLRLYAAYTFTRLSSSFTAACAMALFLASSAFMFARSLVLSDGSVASVPVLWATAAAITLPCLSAFATMRLIADDRQSGRLDLVLSAPVYERDYVLGRFVGAFMYLALAVLLYMAVPLVVLPRCAAGQTISMLTLSDFLPAATGLLSQAMFACAVGLLASSCFSLASVACSVAVGVLVLLPQAIYRAAFAWSPYVRGRFPVFPGELHLSDAASGLFTFSSVAFVVLFSSWAIFSAVKAVAATRFSGRGGASLKWSTLLVVVLGGIFAILAFACAVRLDFSIEWPIMAQAPGFSARTRSILADTHGETRATCFLSRRDPSWRGVSRLLRGLESAARDAAGTRLVVDFADPRWNLSTAIRLARAGVKEGSIVFERDRRRIVVPVSDADESTCASALLRLSFPAGRDTVYWTVGHGEFSFDSYDPADGMSTLARTLRSDGYELKKFDISAATSVPSDCGVLVIAGAKTVFSTAETALVEAYLRGGGRLFVLVSPAIREAGVANMLSRWGVRTLPFTAVSPRTLDGADLVVSDFGEHEVTRPLKGTSVVFQGAVPFAAVEVSGGEKVQFSPLVSTDAQAWGESDIVRRPWTFDASLEPAGPLVLAAAVERGIGQRKDIALKPTRIVVVGDASFVVDGALVSRANANRDLFRNALAWLAGLDAATAPAKPADVLATGMDRAAGVRFTVISALVLPLLLTIVGAFVSLYRRLVR